MRTWTTTLLLILSLTATAQSQVRAQGAEDEWGKGIAFTTSWDEAIKAVAESGKLLFIYNGWQNKGI